MIQNRIRFCDVVSDSGCYMVLSVNFCNVGGYCYNLTVKNRTIAIYFAENWSLLRILAWENATNASFQQIKSLEIKGKETALLQCCRFFKIKPSDLISTLHIICN